MRAQSVMHRHIYFDIIRYCFTLFLSCSLLLPQVKVFQQGSGFCFVTFSEHSAPVMAVQFLPSGHALVSASLDGTVRAYDLLRCVCERVIILFMAGTVLLS